jgi:tetratricopeptide (TPR) repeat protein
MKKYIIYLSAALAVCGGCNKADFLNAKPDQSLVIPSTIADFQAVLDNDNYMNGISSFGLLPEMGEAGSDNLYILDASFNNTLAQWMRNGYIYANTVYSGEQIPDWNVPYRSIYYANNVLDGLGSLTVAADQQTAYNNVLGSALFYRAHCFYQLTQVFSPFYDAASAASPLGIPLRMHADVNEHLERATVKETYDKILGDLLQSVPLLPKLPTVVTRPSKAAAYGLLARLYQTMQDYDKALLYSDSALQLQSSLLNYNTYSTTAQFPFKRYVNSEVIFHCNILGYSANFPTIPYTALVDTVLYASYQANDLRKALFFLTTTGTNKTFQGTYDGSATVNLFAGLATDEMYLIRAECNARKAHTSAAMDDLNTLMITRWKTGTFVPFTAATQQDALNIVLTERRKELCFRGLRWTDLRRLNKEGANITVTHKIAGVSYTLAPNDKKYTWPIPDAVISFNPGMPQNPR